jgi:hypothetical protein
VPAPHQNRSIPLKGKNPLPRFILASRRTLLRPIVISSSNINSRLFLPIAEEEEDNRINTTQHNSIEQGRDSPIVKHYS